MRENLGLGLAYIQEDMGIKLVGIGAEGTGSSDQTFPSELLNSYCGTDIYDANMKLILGLVWSLFKALQTLRIARGAGEPLWLYAPHSFHTFELFILSRYLIKLIFICCTFHFVSSRSATAVASGRST